METFYTLFGNEAIKPGLIVPFYELWDGDEPGRGEELLESGSVCIGEDENTMPVIVDFEIVKKADIYPDEIPDYYNKSDYIARRALVKVTGF